MLADIVNKATLRVKEKEIYRRPWRQQLIEYSTIREVFNCITNDARWAEESSENAWLSLNKWLLEVYCVNKECSTAQQKDEQVKPLDTGPLEKHLSVLKALHVRGQLSTTCVLCLREKLYTSLIWALLLLLLRLLECRGKICSLNVNTINRYEATEWNENLFIYTPLGVRGARDNEAMRLEQIIFNSETKSAPCSSAVSPT